MRVAFAGTPGFALPALRALGARYGIVGVLTQPDRPAGRGRALAASPVKQHALAQGWPVLQPPTLRAPEAVGAIAAWQPDVLVVVAYGLILPQPVLDLPCLGCLNIHGSLLPRWRGAAPIQRAILAGDAVTGVSIMRMEAGLDTGPVLLMRRVPIGPRSTYGELHDLLAGAGAGALLEVLDALEAGRARGLPQPADGVTYAAKIDKAETRIDWRQSAVAIDRQVRAFHPTPVATTLLRGEPLRIQRAHPAAADVGVAAGVMSAPGAKTVPGAILGVARDGLRVACGSGALVLEVLQRAGRRPVSASEFARGLDVNGAVLE
jgi:methionyl-tRNA formyltransferase